MKDRPTDRQSKKERKERDLEKEKDEKKEKRKKERKKQMWFFLADYEQWYRYGKGSMEASLDVHCLKNYSLGFD